MAIFATSPFSSSSFEPIQYKEPPKARPRAQRKAPKSIPPMKMPDAVSDPIGKDPSLHLVNQRNCPASMADLRAVRNGDNTLNGSETYQQMTKPLLDDETSNEVLFTHLQEVVAVQPTVATSDSVNVPDDILPHVSMEAGVFEQDSARGEPVATPQDLPVSAGQLFQVSEECNKGSSPEDPIYIEDCDEDASTDEELPLVQKLLRQALETDTNEAGRRHDERKQPPEKDLVSTATSDLGMIATAISQTTHDNPQNCSEDNAADSSDSDLDSSSDFGNDESESGDANSVGSKGNTSSRPRFAVTPKKINTIPEQKPGHRVRKPRQPSFVPSKRHLNMGRQSRPSRVFPASRRSSEARSGLFSDTDHEGSMSETTEDGQDPRPIKGWLKRKRDGSYSIDFSLDFFPCTTPPPLRLAKQLENPDIRPKAGKGLRYTSAEDAQLIKLRKRNLSWDEISRSFPERSVESLQVHYSTKLRKRD